MARRVPRPGLYRLARAISLAATIVSLIILAYVAATVYSATKVRPGETGGDRLNQTLVPGGLELHLALNFSNPGFLPISSVHLAAVVNSPGNTTTLAVGESPAVMLPAASESTIPLTLTIPLGPGSPILLLLTRDAELPAEVWANITVSSFFSLGVNVSTNVHWGAPFADLNVTPGTPTTSNGSTVEPLTVSFHNDASFPLAGWLNLTAHGTGGCTATVPPIPLHVDPQSPFNQVVPVTVPSACASGSFFSVDGNFASADWSAPIPSEALP